VPENPTVETDSVAGHIGFELRCAKAKFISLNMRQYSDSRERRQTVRSFKENNLLYEAGVLVACTQPFSFVASQFESSHGGLIGFGPRKDFSIFRCFDIGHITSGELRTIHEGSRCGQMSKRIAHFPLDIVRKQSVSGGQWRAEVRSFQMATPSSSPPPAPIGLRGVAVVQRDGALRPREGLI
jgi:hypothetical protein